VIPGMREPPTASRRGSGALWVVVVVARYLYYMIRKRQRRPLRGLTAGRTGRYQSWSV
jgi:hypothetical protein